MKKPALILLMVLLTCSGITQVNPTFIGLKTGVSVPVGQFGGHDLVKGSFTQAGFQGAMEGAWFFKPWIGAGLHGFAALHPIDVGTLGYEKVIADPFMDDVTIRSEPFRTFGGYAGLFFHVLLVKNLSVTGKALGGMIYAKTPYQLYKAEYYLVGEQWFEITSAADYEASFLAGVGIRYDINKSTAFCLDTEFTWNKADFEFITTGNDIRIEEKDISFLNIGVGVIWKISAGE